MKKPKTKPRRSQQRVVRAHRLKKIQDAQRELESALLTLRDHFNFAWTTKCFRELYFLVALSKRAP